MSGLNNLQDQLQKIQLSHPVHDEVPKSPEEGIKRLWWQAGDAAPLLVPIHTLGIAPNGFP